MNDKEIVRQGYDKVSYAYRKDEGDAAHSSDYVGWLRELIPLLMLHRKSDSFEISQLIESLNSP